MGYVQSTNFMEGIGDKAVKRGMAYDYIQRVSYYANWHCIYVYGDWNTILDKLYNGEIDLMAGVSKTPERMEKVLFPDYPMGSESYYIYVHANNPLANQGMAALAGHTVSVNHNTLMETILRNWNDSENHHVRIKTFSGNQSRYNDFYAGKTDATVDTDNAVKPEDKMIPVAKIGQSEFYLAVNRQRPDILKELNTALRKINSTTPGFTNQLSNKYFSGLAVLAQLQNDELAWLKYHPVISVGYVDDYLPLSGTGNNGRPTGIIVDVLNEMVEELKIQDKVQFKYVAFGSYEAMIQGLKNGAVDMVFPANNDVDQAERDDIFLTSEVINAPMYLVYKGDYSDLQLRRMSAKRGNSIGDIYIRAHYPNVELVYYDDIFEVLDAVKDGTVDGCILNQFRKDGYLSHPDYWDLNTFMLKETVSRCFAVKCGNNELLSILNRGITNLPEDFGMNCTYTYTEKISSMTIKDFFLQHIFIFTIVVVLISTVFSGLVAYIILIQRNKRRMAFLAHHDSLTGLLNRQSFDEVIDTGGALPATENLVVIAMDLNGLKNVNDALGHEAGDELIKGAADCMTRILSPYGTVYRIGGDEFMSVLYAEPDQWPDIIQRLKEAFNGWKGEKVDKLSVSVGSVVFNEAENLTMKKMVTMADERMYQDKAEYYRHSGADRRKNR
ncbi:putative sensory box/GGDEF family protein [Anaerovibrio sp. JC8]|nr:putative sensory box/GGDEF family protein [Anaerovibrio sp. JC8]